MPDSSIDRDPLDVLAEEFVARYRAGEFRILRCIGTGGMGVVYEAIQESLGRHVALKVLPPEALADPKRLERFRREAKAAARLHHTNIVPVFGTGEADSRHYYAMQFIAGHPLDAVIDEVRRLKHKSSNSDPHPVSEVAAAALTGTLAGPQSDSDPAQIRSRRAATAAPGSAQWHGPHRSRGPCPSALRGAIQQRSGRCPRVVEDGGEQSLHSGAEAAERTA